jgi:CTD small phosphatase-like protein 2
MTSEGIYIKDLRVINRSLQDMVLVDNAAYSFAYQLDNGIPIIPFYDDKNDKELRYLTEFMKKIIGIKDLREANRKIFKFHTFSIFESVEKFLGKILKS